eukprot:Amastigsp_a343808_5.p3 type:complete len:101 gc:universal Amastigsp_a343808_5:172-474(+)
MVAAPARRRRVLGERPLGSHDPADGCRARVPRPLRDPLRDHGALCPHRPAQLSRRVVPQLDPRRVRHARVLHPLLGSRPCASVPRARDLCNLCGVPLPRH